MDEFDNNEPVMAKVYLSLGSNMGNREELLRSAAGFLSSEAGEVIRYSSLWETEPWGFEAETSFLNMAVIITTRLSPEEMLKKVHSIEKRLGRLRSVMGYQSRTIDIDILFWDNEVISKRDLIVPHPALAERLFVLVPLNEIAPDYCHPITGKAVSEMLTGCGDNSKISLFGPF